ncbi:MAG: Calx-beta domain-containing protein, partial [Verrucomicrobiota bacterium]|nr:Calx-beta domain-containing protein [Verrucomicrobiota bacterium]
MFSVTRSFISQLYCSGRRVVSAALIAVAFTLVALNSVHAQTTNSVVQFSSATYQTAESFFFATIIVERTGSLDELVTVDYNMTDGTAVTGVDYIPTPGTLTFFPGEQFASFFVIVFDNSTVDPNRTVNLQLSNPQSFSGTTLGNPSTAVLTIFDDDTVDTGGAGTVQFNLSTYTAYHDEYIIDGRWDEEPEGIQITIIRPSGSYGKIAVDWATSTNG